MRLLLELCLSGVAVLSAFYLRQRIMPVRAYLGWGLLVVFLPLIGPFLVMLIHPGNSIKNGAE